MSNDTEYERTKEYLKGKLPMYLRSKNINVNAPFTCLNPEHHDTEQSMHYEKQSHTVNCSKCNARYDIFDVVKLMYNLDSFAQSFNKVHEMYLGPVPDEMNKDQPSLIASKQRQFMMPKNSFSEQSLLHGASASNMDEPQRNSWQRAQAEINPTQVKSIASVKYATNFGSSATSKNSTQGSTQNGSPSGLSSMEQSGVPNTAKSKTLGTAIITEGTSSSVKSRKAQNVSRQEPNIPKSRTVKNGTSVARITAVSLSPEERRKLSEIKNLDQLPSDIAESVLSSERLKSSRQLSEHQRQEPTLQLPQEDNLNEQQPFGGRRNYKTDTGFKIDPSFKNDTGFRIDPSFTENTLQRSSVFNSDQSAEKYTSDTPNVRAQSDFSLPQNFSLPQALSQGETVFKPVVESTTVQGSTTPNFFENAQKSNLGKSSYSTDSDAATLGVGAGIDPSISEKVNKAYANVWGEHDKVNQQKRAAAAQAAIESQKRRQREEEFSKKLQQQQYQNLGHSSLGLEIQDDSPYLSPNQNIKDFEQAKAKRQVLNESNFISGNVKLDLPESLQAQLQQQASDPHALVETLAATSPFTQIRPQTLGDTGALQAISNKGGMRNHEQHRNRLSNAAYSDGEFTAPNTGSYQARQYHTGQATASAELYGHSSDGQSSVISRTLESQEINSSPIADMMSKLNGTSNGSTSNGNSRLGKGATTADLNTSTPSNEWKQVFGNAELRLLNPSAPSTLINGRAYDTQLDEQTLRTNIERNLASDTARIQAENARTPSSLYETAKGRPEQPSTHIYGSAVNNTVKDDSLAAPRPSASDPYIAAKHPSSTFASMVAANTASSLGDSTAIGVTGNSLSAMVGAAMAKDMAKAASEQNANTSTLIQRSSNALSSRVGIESTAGLSQSISEQIRKEQNKNQQHNEGTTRIVGVISKVEPQAPLEQSTRIIVSDPNSQPVQDQLPPLETGSSYSSTIFSGVMKDKLIHQNKSKDQQAKKGHRGPKIDFSSVKTSAPDSTFTTETSHSVQIDLTNLEMDRVATLNAQTNKTNEKQSTPLNFYARAQDAIDDPSLASKAILVDEYPSRNAVKSLGADGSEKNSDSASAAQTTTNSSSLTRAATSAASSSTEELTQALAKSAAAISAAAAIKAASDSFDKDLEELGIKEKSSTKHSLSESAMVKELKSSLNSLDKLLESTSLKSADDKLSSSVELNTHEKGSLVSSLAPTSSSSADKSHLSLMTDDVLGKDKEQSLLKNREQSTLKNVEQAASENVELNTLNKDKDPNAKLNALAKQADGSHHASLITDNKTVRISESSSSELSAAQHVQNSASAKEHSDTEATHNVSTSASSNPLENTGSTIDKLTPEEKEKALKLGIELLHAEDLLKDPSKLPAHARVIMANKTQKISSNQQDALEIIQELIASKQQAASESNLAALAGDIGASSQMVNPQPSKVITPTMITAPGSKIPIAAPTLPQMQQPANPMLNPAMMGNPMLGQPMVNQNLLNVMNAPQTIQSMQPMQSMQTPMGVMGGMSAVGVNPALGMNQTAGVNQVNGVHAATNNAAVVSASGQTVVSGQGAAQNALQAALNPAQTTQAQQQAMLQNQKLEEANHHGASILTQTTAISGLAQEQAAALSQGLVHQDLDHQNPTAVTSAGLNQNSTTTGQADGNTNAALEFWVQQKGLSPEIVERFNLGYLSQLPVGNQTWKAGLIPLSEDYQQILNVQTGQSMIMGAQEAPCFNLSVLSYEGDGIANAIFIVSSPLDALSLESLGAHALALTKPENASVLLEYLQENQHQSHAFYISLENTKAWQAATERLTWGLNALQQPFKLINLAAPFDTISLALYHDRSGLLNRLQSPEVLNSLVISPSLQNQDAAEPQAASALAQETSSLTPTQSATLNNQFQLLEVFAPMKDSGLILSTESLAKLQLSNVLYTMTTSSVAVSRLVLSSVILNQEPVLFAGSKMQWQMICNRLASLPVGGVLSNTGLNPAAPASPEATHDMASGIAPQPCQARLVELPLEFDTKSLLITLTQAVMTARNSLPNFGSLRLMLDTFSFEERFCAALAPLLAELALSLNLPIMVWCTNEQKSYFEGQSVQTIEMSKGMDNEIIFKTLDQDCHLHTFRSLPR